jgi:hypothetical protein
MITQKDKGLIEIELLSAVLLSMNRELTAMLAICRGEDKKTECSLCGEPTDSKEIKEYNGFCEYCALQDERAERYQERSHPDE